MHERNAHNFPLGLAAPTLGGEEAKKQSSKEAKGRTEKTEARERSVLSCLLKAPEGLCLDALAMEGLCTPPKPPQIGLE